jgi:GrpB-like predicted nucleotidyltransferase (UPF0157 family)
MAASIGLPRHTVALQPYDLGWTEAFSVEAKLIRGVLGEYAQHVEHVGSTAVPGLAAKPVIDMMLGMVNDRALVTITQGLVPLGYVSFGDRRNDGDWFFAKGPETSRTHYVHVVLFGDQRWRNYLRFRDRLRADARLCDEYSRLKTELAAQFADDRDAYTQAKESFITRVIHAD